jgi:hypothetical protein
MGLGATGLEVAKKAKSFGMYVIAVMKSPFLKKEGIDKAYFVDNLGGSDHIWIYDILHSRSTCYLSLCLYESLLPITITYDTSS